MAEQRQLNMSISIITINRNNASGLKATIDSVLTQTSQDFEYIIVDGASADKSVEIVKAATENHEIKWISEPDSGIYNAMNKGVRMATGDYVIFLNSGDTFANEKVLEEIQPLLDGSEFVIGRVNVTKNGKIVQTSKNLGNQDLSLYNLYLYGIPHQAAFIKKELLERTPYDESLKINADWKSFVQEIVLRNASVRLTPLIISNYDGEGYSSTHMKDLLIERRKVFEVILPERIASDYLQIFPHYYEVERVKWLLEHPIFYKLYRATATLGMKFCK